MKPVDNRQPGLLIFSSLFPHTGAPNAGIFIRERMFRVGHVLPITVVSPRPWFPGQGIIRFFRPHFRQPAPKNEIQSGIEVVFPRFFSIPGALKKFDGFFMAMGSYWTLRRLKTRTGFNIVDAHFAYPDGYAATLLGKWLKLPVTITLRGTEIPQSRTPALRPLLIRALERASMVFSVSESLRQHAISLGIDPAKITVIGNGVDTEKFMPALKAEARTQLGLNEEARVLISVGGLVERKGFHRVIEVLPNLIKIYPNLIYLVVGGAGPEGDWSEQLRTQVTNLKLEKTVIFLGVIPSDKLKFPLSASDIFVLATSNEGWANVFLEAMACGLPVITTDVGGNREVVCHDELGSIVPFGDAQKLESALLEALARKWDKEKIISYAANNSWDSRVEILVEAFKILFEEKK